MDFNEKKVMTLNPWERNYNIKKTSIMPQITMPYMAIYSDHIILDIITISCTTVKSFYKNAYILNKYMYIYTYIA